MSGFTGLSPQSPTNYVGPNVALNTVVSRNRAPTGADYRMPETGKLYPFNTFWLVAKDPTTGTQGDLWYLSKIVANVAYWVMLSANTDTGIFGVNVDAFTPPGTNPVLPDGSNLITVTGGQIAAGSTSNVVRTNSLAANTFTVEIQRSQAVASSTIADNGVSHFDSSIFSVDANGFVGLSNSFYNTGFFTPLLAFGGLSTGITYSSGGAQFTQIGNVLYYAFSFTLTSKGSATGNATVGGFPVIMTGGGDETLTEGNVTFDMGNTYIYSSPNIGLATISLFQSGSGIGTTNLTDTNFSNSSVIVGSGFYFIT